MAVQIQLRRDTAANWLSVNPVLAQGELGVETDTGKMKLGNGVDHWDELAYNPFAASLNDLSNVTINSVQNGDFLRYNGSASVWINDPVNLATDTVGDYVQSLVAGTGLTITNNSGEGSTPTIAVSASAYDAYGSAEAIEVVLLGEVESLYEAIDVLTTTDIAEGTNLYFTNQRAIDATISSYDLVGSASVATISAVSQSNIYTDGRISDLTTTDIEEGTNLYFTNLRAINAASATYDAIGAASTAYTNAVAYADGLTTTDIAEGTSLYFTDERAQDAVGNSVGTGLTYTDGTGAIAVNTSVIQERVANVTDTEIGYLDGVTSAIQTQIDNKLASSTASTTYAPIASPTFTGVVTLPDNTVALGTKTTGDYVASLVAGTGLTITNNSGESTTPTIAIGQSVATSASPTFGSLSTTGAMYVGTDLHVGGVYYTTVETNLAIEDSFIYLNDGNTISNPDLGIAGNYNDGTYRHAGVFRDATDGKWKFFDSYTPEPTDPINTAHASYSAAPLVAKTFESTIATGTAPMSVSSSTVVTNLNADLLDGQEGSYYLNTSSTLDNISDVSASAPVDYSPLVWSTSASAWVANSQYLTLGQPGTTDYLAMDTSGIGSSTAAGENFTVSPSSFTATDGTGGPYFNLNANNVTFSNGTDSFMIDPYWGTSGQVLAFSPGGGSGGTWGPTTLNLDNIADVSASAPADGEFLKYVSASSAWVPASVPTINAIDDIGDVIAPSPTDGYFLKYVSASSSWVPAAVPTINALDDIGNVSASAPLDNSPLTWSSSASAWVANGDSLKLENANGVAEVSPYGFGSFLNAGSGAIDINGGYIYISTADTGSLDIQPDYIQSYTPGDGPYYRLDPNSVTLSNGTDVYMIDPYWGTSGQVLAFTPGGGNGGTWGPSNAVRDNLVRFYMEVM